MSEILACEQQWICFSYRSLVITTIQTTVINYAVQVNLHENRRDLDISYKDSTELVE